MAIKKKIHCANCGMKFQPCGNKNSTASYFCSLKCRVMVSVEVDDETGCWKWVAGIFPNGYGQMSVSGSGVGAHRVSYEAHKGRIPPGLVLDHLCRNKRCVNPDHLEAVTNEINSRRGNLGLEKRRQTHCARGHGFVGRNVIIRDNGTRKCRECHNALQRKRLGYGKDKSHGIEALVCE